MIRKDNRFNTITSSLSPQKARNTFRKTTNINSQSTHKKTLFLRDKYPINSPRRKDKCLTTFQKCSNQSHTHSTFFSHKYDKQRKLTKTCQTQSKQTKFEQLGQSTFPNFLKLKNKKSLSITEQAQILLKQPESYNKSQKEIKGSTLDDFEIGQMLGKGANGSVYVVRHKKTGFFFAMKRLFKEKLADNITRFIATIKLQLFLDDPNVSRLYQIFSEGKQIILIMELCADGDLTHRVKDLRKNNESMRQVIRGIVKGLKYLHSRKILHRDLKLQNILLCHQMPKITDFDLAVYQANPNQSRRTFCGSPAYFSPQMLTKNSYNSKVDIWCLGILCYELVCGYFPFEISNFAELNNIVNQPIKQFPPEVDPTLKQFIQMALVKNPDQRAGWKQILTHKIMH